MEGTGAQGIEGSVRAISCLLYSPKACMQVYMNSGNVFLTRPARLLRDARDEFVNLLSLDRFAAGDAYWSSILDCSASASLNRRFCGCTTSVRRRSTSVHPTTNRENALTPSRQLEVRHRGPELLLRVDLT